MSSQTRVESHLRTDIAAHFRTALLISADPSTAEEVVASSIAECIGFVLRLLLGYSKAACAAMMRIPESEVGPLLANALVQLHEISEASALHHHQRSLHAN